MKAGHGHVVLLSGEGGIGKSRLVHRLKEHIANEPHMRWECRSAPSYQHTALFPLTELFQRMWRFEAQETPDEKFSKLAHALSQYRLPLEESVPLFAPLLSLPIPAHRYPPLTLSPQDQRQKTLEAIVTVLLAQAERHPMLFILEDLHWTDPSTLELLNLVIDQAPTTSILTVLTCRPTFQPTWSHRSYVTEVTVNRLSQPQIERMATHVAGGKPLPSQVLHHIVDKTDGVPLFVEEITKAILESGYLKDTDEHYELLGSLSTVAIPATLQDSLMARLDRLVTAKAVAQYAAVIGRQFAYGLLQAVSHVDAVRLQHELRRLVEAELLYQRGLPPHATYTFKHALIQEAAYQSLLRSTRRHYHEQIAHAFAEQFPETAETQPELLAFHALRGEVWDKALLYYRQAGAKAHAGSAYREAVGCLEQALEALAHLPPDRTTLEQAVDLHSDFYVALQPFGQWEQILTHLRAAETVAEALADHRRLGRVCRRIANTFRQLQDYQSALTYCQRTHALATALEDIELQIGLNMDMGQIYFDLGNFRQAIEWLQQILTALQGMPPDQSSGGVALPSVQARVWMAGCLSELGAFATAVTYGDEARQIAEAVGRPYERLAVYRRLGQLRTRQGTLPQAIPVLEQAVALSQDASMPMFYSTSAPALALAYALAGCAADALAVLQQLAGSTDVPSYRVIVCGEAYLRVGDVEEAHRLAQHTLTHARARNMQGQEACALWLLGEIAMQRDPPDVTPATAHYEQALTLAEALGMRPLLAHCHRGLGTLYAKTGQRERARAALATAIELYGAMDMMFWLPQVEVALAQVEGQ